MLTASDTRLLRDSDTIWRVKGKITRVLLKTGGIIDLVIDPPKHEELVKALKVKAV